MKWRAHSICCGLKKNFSSSDTKHNTTCEFCGNKALPSMFSYDFEVAFNGGPEYIKRTMAADNARPDFINVGLMKFESEKNRKERRAAERKAELERMSKEQHWDEFDEEQP